MIYVTVGNDFRPFDRLLRKMDEIAPSLPEPVLMQRGYSAYCPRNTEYFDFVPMHSATEYLLKSRLVVSHAGIGTIILCKRYGVPLLILPRRMKFGEHMNDHQLEIVQALEERRDGQIRVLFEEGGLKETILEQLAEARKDTPADRSGRITLARALREFLQAAF